MGRIAAFLGVLAVALLAPVASASATDYYVNKDTGSDTNSCLQPTVGGAGVGPCDTIGHAIDLAEDSNGSRVLISDQTYFENLTGSTAVSNGMTLTASDGGVDPKPVINGYIDIDATGASFNHLKVTSAAPTNLITVAGPGTIADNEIVGNDASGGNAIDITGSTGTATITRNAFTDNGSGDQTAVSKTIANISLVLTDNTISGFWRGFFGSDVAGAVIRRNQISGAHAAGSDPGAIVVYGGLGYEITGNTADTTNPGGYAIDIGSTNQPGSATLSRNRVTGPWFAGISAGDTVSFSSTSDVVNGAQFSLISSDLAPLTASSGNVTITNATLWNATVNNVIADGTDVTLNSSITGSDISDNVVLANGGTCAVSFSRGDPGFVNDCSTFQTTANPLFVNEGAGDLHLQPGSPMIDAGDPAAPAGLLDIDGEPRAMGGVAGCVVVPSRRDIGADEFTAPVVADVAKASCTPPVPVTTTDTQAAKKKCKMKKKRAATAKKRCRKKKK